jgi:DNA-binding MarR family transcriptional regulator/N-acetylglutamate synthase-like GNAT family acetyltransferase
VAAPSRLEAEVEAARRFNRFYTRLLGVLDEGLLDSAFSLAECRVLYEIAQRPDPAASEIGAALGLDAGYLSRIVGGFERKGLVERRPAPADRRRSLLRLTRAGRKTFDTLNQRSQAEVESSLRRLDSGSQQRLLTAMGTIERLLGDAQPEAAAAPACVLRDPRPGDIGWMIHRHGVLYAREYGWTAEFEALAARIAGRFLERFDPARERCWIAERDGEIVGSVMLVRKSRTVAQLRMLLVEPAARGSGLGGRLVDECVRFARRAGYSSIVLWTNSVLTSARHLYERAGFTRVKQERLHAWGQYQVYETWRLRLPRASPARGGRPARARSRPRA